MKNEKYDTVGAGRTGEWWAVNHSNVVPDILVFANGVGSGMPISGVASRSALTDNQVREQPPPSTNSLTSLHITSVRISSHRITSHHSTHFSSLGNALFRVLLHIIFFSSVVRALVQEKTAAVPAAQWSTDMYK